MKTYNKCKNEKEEEYFMNDKKTKSLQTCSKYREQAKKWRKELQNL